ncbi:MAG TPA: protein-glutamate O-methyltransferase CheR [Myxococcales bacterium]|jgi:chemotaxis protein methyltransferase CheR|nr:protein-glutamate O-methyltransferase CheR [Myxococcales bacterium]
MSAADAIEPVAALVARRTGLVFPESRREALSAAVANAISRTKARTAADLVAHLETVPEALDHLVSELTVHESYFFRYPGQFEILRRTVLPEILSRRGPGHQLRLLSVGCAGGEEPYSLAILLDQEGLERRSLVTGADISRPSLTRAKAGTYGRWSLRGTSDDFLSTYFRRDGDRYQLIPALRERVTFTYLNLADDFFRQGLLGRFDVIFCRNALIYFDAATIAAAAGRILSALDEGGWVFTAASDPQLSAHAPFATVMTAEGLLYRRLTEMTAPREEPAVEPLAPPPTPPPPRRPVAVREPAVPAPATASPTVLAPESPAARVRALADAGNVAEALAAAETASRLAPDSTELHYLRAVLLAEAGRDRDAADVLRRVLYLDGQLAVAALALGLVLRRLGDRPGSKRALIRARALAAARPAGEPLPLADGEVSGRFVLTVDAQLRLLTGGKA